MMYFPKGNWINVSSVLVVFKEKRLSSYQAVTDLTMVNGVKEREDDAALLTNLLVSEQTAA